MSATALERTLAGADPLVWSVRLFDTFRGAQVGEGRRSLAYRVIGREEDARDVVQETFLRAFRALPGFKGQAKFSSWLYRIALNLCRDWIRRQKRTPVVAAPEGVDIIELAAEQGPVESIETLVVRKQLSETVAEAMQHLPEEQRTAIILKEYHGLTFQEIADLLDCPLSTVKTRLYQGLTVLRRHLHERDEARLAARPAGSLDPIPGSTN